jgi:hypothetical protein
MKASPRTRSSAEFLREISAKRRVDLVTAAHRALATHLRKAKEFAKRYPTLTIQPYRIGNEVGLRIGTRRTGSKAEYNWENIRVVLQFDQGVFPPDVRRAAALWETHDVVTAVLIPKLLATLPNVTRKDVVTLIKDAWASSRGIRSTPLFDPRLVQAASRALARENPHWGARAVREELAKRLNVSARTVANLTRKKS